MKSLAQQRIDAAKFSERWKGKGDEKQECHKFWLDFLENVLGVVNPLSKVEFEKEVKVGKTAKYIDLYIPSCKLLIEQKSSKVSKLDEVYHDQVEHTYIVHMDPDETPRYVIVCNFKSFQIYDRKADISSPRVIVKLSELSNQIHQFNFIVDPASDVRLFEEQVSTNAGKIMQTIYNHFAEYKVNVHELNMFCTRLVFCFYAEDAGVFPGKKQFSNYIKEQGRDNIAMRIADVFKVLNTPYEKRSKILTKELQTFPYVNGGLFAIKDNESVIPDCDNEAYGCLLDLDCDHFDWSQISPAVFGSIFESTLNPETRKVNGMHYTSVRNIHKVIYPMFLVNFEGEYKRIITYVKPESKQVKELAALQKEMAALTFLDPACGSGNFLTETYIRLRRLENKIIGYIYNTDQGYLGDEVTPIKVRIDHFYGIEKEDFAVTVAKTALWIAEFQMRQETAAVIKLQDEFLPLHSSGNIVEGNALTMDWSSVVKNVSYIIGNPPFKGYAERTAEQTKELHDVFGDSWKHDGIIDYVGGWFKKAADYMTQSPNTATAFVATNSICQGMQVKALWEPLFKDGVHIDLAWRSFKWRNESTQQAQVTCVIVGFSKRNEDDDLVKVLYTTNKDDTVIREFPEYINAYLKGEVSFFVNKRKKPIQSDALPMFVGNKLVDNQNYLFNKEEMEAFLKSEPKAQPYFHPLIGAAELVGGAPRWCLDLSKCTPDELAQMPKCIDRIQRVKEFRLASKKPATNKLATAPTCFEGNFATTGKVLAIPGVSSSSRKYIPMAFVEGDNTYPETITVMPNASLYEFGVLTSLVHMAWVRLVCGQHGNAGYNYSVSVVYNNFIWPNATEKQKKAIEKTAQAILDARAEYPKSTLANLYNDTLMPQYLRDIHSSNDDAVLWAYGMPRTVDEEEIKRMLRNLYVQRTKSPLQKS